jgi:hypothetical protein
MAKLMQIRGVVRGVVAAAALAVAAAGCGDEPQAKKPTAPAAGPRSAAKKGAGAKKAGGKGARLETYLKVPDEYRRVFIEKDFRPDLTGDENRDPFRSYVTRLPGARTTAAQENAPKIEVTELCTKDNSKATNYSLRDLRLIGIVLRGTKGYAQFRDSRQYGHTVHKGDCLGKEKARVEAIGAGFVRLEVTQEAPPGAAAPPPEKKDWVLHPEEVTYDSEEGSGEEIVEGVESPAPAAGGPVTVPPASEPGVAPVPVPVP